MDINSDTVSLLASAVFSERQTAIEELATGFKDMFNYFSRLLVYRNFSGESKDYLTKCFIPARSSESNYSLWSTKPGGLFAPVLGQSASDAKVKLKTSNDTKGLAIAQLWSAFFRKFADSPEGKKDENVARINELLRQIPGLILLDFSMIYPVSYDQGTKTILAVNERPKDYKIEHTPRQFQIRNMLLGDNPSLSLGRFLP